MQDGPLEREIDRFRLASFQTNSDSDKAAYYLAVSKWFQDRHTRHGRDYSDYGVDAEAPENVIAATIDNGEQAARIIAALSALGYAIVPRIAIGRDGRRAEGNA